MSAARQAAMTRAGFALTLVLSVLHSACTASDPDDEQRRGTGGKADDAVVCTGSEECESGSHCSTEDGDCDSLCEPGEVCAAVCAGTCVTDAIVCTSSNECGPGNHCTTDDGACDSICEPGEVC